MNKVNWIKYVEGFLVTLLGILCVVGSIQLPNNPVRIRGWVSFFVQARFIPLITGAILTLLGVLLIFTIHRERDAKTFRYEISAQEIRTLLIVVAIVGAYILGILNFGFLAPTALYLPAILFFLNYQNTHPIKILLIAAVFFIVGYWLTPMLLRINLP